MHKQLKGISFVVTGNLTEMKVVGWHDDSVKQIAIEGVVSFSETNSASVSHTFNGTVWGMKIVHAHGGSVFESIINAFNQHETEMHYAGR